MPLYLLFRIGADRYAIDARDVAEVLPLLPLKGIPGAPAWAAGMLAWRGNMVPVVDLAAYSTGVPAARCASTRIVLVDCPPRRSAAENGQPAGIRWLGLRLAHVTDTLRCAADEFVDSGVAFGELGWLGPVRADAEGIVQRVLLDAMLPDEVLAMLGGAAADGAMNRALDPATDGSEAAAAP